jgi:hypothetical protein
MVGDHMGIPRTVVFFPLGSCHFCRFQYEVLFVRSWLHTHHRIHYHHLLHFTFSLITKYSLLFALPIHSPSLR